MRKVIIAAVACLLLMSVLTVLVPKNVDAAYTGTGDSYYYSGTKSTVFGTGYGMTFDLGIPSTGTVGGFLFYCQGGMGLSIMTSGDHFTMHTIYRSGGSMVDGDNWGAFYRGQSYYIAISIDYSSGWWDCYSNGVLITTLFQTKAYDFTNPYYFFADAFGTIANGFSIGRVDMHTHTLSPGDITTRPLGDIGSYLFDRWLDNSVNVTDHSGYNRPLTYYGPVYGGPVADFSASPVSGLAPLTVQFTDMSTFGTNPGQIDSALWAWDFGDGSGWHNGSTSMQNPTWTYNETGTYNVTLYVLDFWGQDAEVKTGYIVVTSIWDETGIGGTQAQFDQWVLFILIAGAAGFIVMAMTFGRRGR